MNNTFILHPIKKKKETFYVLFILIYYGVLNIGDQSWRVPSLLRMFFKKLHSALKWINCCNKSINACVFTAGIVCIIYLNFCCHVITTNQIWNLNELLSAAICSDPSFVVPGDLEVVIFVLKLKKKWWKLGMVSDLFFLSSTNHVQTLRHVQSHLH